MNRWFRMLAILVVGGVATAIAQPPGGGYGHGGPPDDTRERRPANDNDHGRPVEKIAQELGVSPDKFREVFSRVKPAGRGEVPTKEQREGNRQILSEGLGVSPERLDEVMDKYRPEGPSGGEGRGPAGRNSEGRGPSGGDRSSNGRGWRGRGGPENRGRPNGPPPLNPQRFVEHALEFDADDDGKLDRDELMRFAEDMGPRRIEQEGAGARRCDPDCHGGPPEGSGCPERDRRAD